MGTPQTELMVKPEENIRIRAATADDAEAIMAVRVSVIDNALDREQLARLGITEESLREMIGCSHGCWCAESSGGVIGFSMSDRANALIEALFVSPGQVGAGIGSRLLARAVEDLRELGHTQLRLFTGKGTPAIGFYRKHGWILTGGTKGGDVEMVLDAGYTRALD